MRVCSETLLVSQLVGYSEGQWEASVLTNAATAMRLTHPRHMGQTQSLTRPVDGCTDVLPVRSVCECYQLKQRATQKVTHLRSEKNRGRKVVENNLKNIKLPANCVQLCHAALILILATICLL